MKPSLTKNWTHGYLYLKRGFNSACMEEVKRVNSPIQMLKERYNLHGVLYKDLDPSLEVVFQRYLGQITIHKIS